MYFFVSIVKTLLKFVLLRIFGGLLFTCALVEGRVTECSESVPSDLYIIEVLSCSGEVGVSVVVGVSAVSGHVNFESISEKPAIKVTIG